MENEDKIKEHERMAVLETNVKTIMDNHLPHLQKAIDNLGAKFWAVIILSLAILLGVFIK